MPSYELDPRKGLHVKLLADTHAGLKVQACRLKLSMQAIMDELASLVVQEDPYIIKHLRELARQKRTRESRALSEADSDTLLDHIEEYRRSDRL